MFRPRRPSLSPVVRLFLYIVFAALFGYCFLVVVKAKRRSAGIDDEFDTASSLLVQSHCAVGKAAALASFNLDFRAFLSEIGDAVDEAPGKAFAEVRDVERRAAADFPPSALRAMLDNGLPVVVEGAALFKGAPLTRDTLRARCGRSTVQPAVPSGGGTVAKLTKLRAITVARFLQGLEENLNGPKGDLDTRDYYLHDWQIGPHCPWLLENYTVPAYWEHNILGKVQVTKKSGGVLDWVWPDTSTPASGSWPSLFVGNKGTATGLHVDRGATHFSLFMVSGQKKVRVLQARDRIVAYENRFTGQFGASLFDPDFALYPHLAWATVLEATVGPGDLLFVPARAPHEAVNLSPVVSVSTNFVDESNAGLSAKVFLEEGDYAFAEALRNTATEG